MNAIEPLLAAVPKGRRVYAELERWLKILAAEDLAGRVPDPVWEVLDALGFPKKPGRTPLWLLRPLYPSLDKPHQTKAAEQD